MNQIGKIDTQKLKEVILKTELSISAFAYGCNIDPACIHNVLSGKNYSVTLENALKICVFLGIVDVRELVVSYEKDAHFTKTAYKHKIRKITKSKLHR
jgi:DNA-binding Xre family transcriptional regulator